MTSIILKTIVLLYQAEWHQSEPENWAKYLYTFPNQNAEKLDIVSFNSL